MSKMLKNRSLEKLPKCESEPLDRNLFLPADAKENPYHQLVSVFPHADIEVTLQVARRIPGTAVGYSPKTNSARPAETAITCFPSIVKEIGAERVSAPR